MSYDLKKGAFQDLCEHCGNHLAIKTDSQGKLICHHCLHPSVTVVRPPREQLIFRNDPCFCGSGKKFKKCCRLKGNQTVFTPSAVVGET